MRSLSPHRIKKKRDSGNSEQIQKAGGWHDINNPDSGKLRNSFPAMDQALETENQKQKQIIKMLLKSGANGGKFLERAIESMDSFVNVEILLRNGVEADAFQTKSF